MATHLHHDSHRHLYFYSITSYLHLLIGILLLINNASFFRCFLNQFTNECTLICSLFQITFNFFTPFFLYALPFSNQLTRLTVVSSINDLKKSFAEISYEISGAIGKTSILSLFCTIFEMHQFSLTIDSIF